MPDERLNERYQLTTELLAIALLFFVLFISGALFLQGAGANQLSAMSEDLSALAGFEIGLTPHLFGALCWTGACFALAFRFKFFRQLPGEWKRRIYSLTPIALLLYVVPVGWMLIKMGVLSVTPVVYLVIYFSFVIIARATYRH